MHLYSQTYHTVMDILPLCVMVSFIHGVTLVLSNDVTVNNICLETINGSSTVPLSCGSNKRIHVISERYGNTTHEQCGQNTSNIYATFMMNNDDGLIVNCNGKKNTICHEGILGSVSCKPVCAIESKHECVADSMSVCSVVNTWSQNEIVYLHSPGFPDPDKEDNNCSCRITGPMMTVTVLEYHPGDGAVSIFPDSKPVFPSVFTLYNRVIATRVSTVVVNYEDKNETGSMWIKVTGTGPLNIVCMEVSNITSSKITTSTQATTKDLTSNSESTYSNPGTPSTSNDRTTGVTTDAVSGTSDTVTPLTSNDRTEEVTDVTTDAVSGTSDTVTPSTSNARTEEEVTEAVSSTSDAGLSKLLVIALSGAAGGLLLLVLITVTVVCCRRRSKSCQHTEEKDNGRKNLVSPKTQQMHSFQNNVFIGNNQADRVHIKLDVVIEPYRSVENKSTDQRAKVVPKGLRTPLHNKDEAADSNICHMVDNNIYVDGPMINETPREGMVDNHQSCSMKYFIAETETKAPENIDDLGDQEIAMVVNDLYHSYQPTADQSNGNGVSNEPPQAAETLNIDGQENNKEEGMITNDLYHSYQSTADQSNSNSAPPQAAETLNIKDEEHDKEKGMIINDLFHSYQPPADRFYDNSVSNEPPQAAETLNIDEQEKDKEEGMIINDLYHSYQSTADRFHNSGSNEPPQAAEKLNIDDQEKDKEEGMIINDLYHSYQTTPGCET